MKKFNLIAGLFLLPVLLMLSCTDLEEQYLDSFADEELTLKQAVPSSDVKSSMARLRSCYASQNNFFALLTHPTDEFMGPTRGSDWDDNGTWRNLHNHSFPADNDQILAGFNQIVAVISSANSEIFNATNDMVKAKARVLRAFAVFMMADMWGSVPYRDETATSKDYVSPPKTLTRKEAITLAIREITESLVDLPEKGGSGYVYGEPTKDVARAILAKIFLNKFIYDGVSTAPSSDMDSVLFYTDSIINGAGKYALADNYFVDNFGKDNDKSPEAIFMIPITSTELGNMASRFRQQMHYNHPGALSGWNGFTTLASFYDSFDPSDPRLKTVNPDIIAKYGVNLGFLIGQQKDKSGVDLKDRQGNALSYTKDVPLFGANEVQGIRILKYVPNNDNDERPVNDVPVIRYADVLLMKAEALWRKGNNADALTVLNTIRAKRGVSVLGAISADGSEILKERGFELYNEGWKRNDQVRFGTFLRAWEEKPQSPARAVLFPIPQVILDVNSNLKQNPGY